MSAGICIMNKNAIALAADSAVTVGNHLAIHNSANKLFNVSRVAPIGVIIYANATFMNIPFELILKQYKKQLADNTFSTLQEYVKDFFQYLIQNVDLFHFKTNEVSYITSVVTDLLSGLIGDYQRLLQEKISKVNRELTPEEIENIQDESIRITINYIDQQNILENTHFYEYLKDQYIDTIHHLITTTIPWISSKDLSLLNEEICKLFDKKFFRNNFTGLTFAGYGENEIFPNMIHVHLGGIINNDLRYTIIETKNIQENDPAFILPLAQTDVMQTFLFGINDQLLNEIARKTEEQVHFCFNNLSPSYFSDGKKDKVRQIILTSIQPIINQIALTANQNYLLPITQSISSLPIEELALLAESMINITSLRRKVALDNNIGTVGGPIDVAIITKSDGFIWIKRKHYFKQEYNPQYYYSHYWNIGGNFNGEPKHI